MEITANFETEEDGEILQVLRPGRGLETLHIVVGRGFNGPHPAGTILGGGATAPHIITIAPGHAKVEPWRMPPHLCGLVRGGIKPVPMNRTGRPSSVRLRFTLVPVIVVSGFIATGALPVTVRVVRFMRVGLSIGGPVTRGGPMFGERRWLVVVTGGCAVLVAMRVREIEAVWY